MVEMINLNKTYQVLLVLLSFLMPLTVFGANLIIAIICILWLISGNYKSKYHQIISNRLMLASIVFFCLHVLGLLWTEDLIWGLHIVHKMWYFLLLLPVLYTIVKKDNISLYISAFLLAITLTEITSYLVWFEVIEPFKNATVKNPTPFMSHISYNPILAFSIYLVAHQLFFNKDLTKIKLLIYGFLASSMTINMFITGGRAGQVMFFAMIAILIFQIFNYKKLKAFVVISIVIPLIFFIAYQTSSIFQNRVDLTIHNIANFSENQNTSIGERFVFNINSLEIIKQHPFFGVGTGDFKVEYKRVNEVNTPYMANAAHPHNMYTLVLVQLGLLGLLSMLSIFYFQIKLSFNEKNKYLRDVGLTLPLLFLVIMLSDSYLLGHFTTLMYVFFSSFLYKKA